MANKAEEAVAAYMRAVKDPQSLRDDDLIMKLTDELAATDDPIARLELRQQISHAQNPSMAEVEEAFVTHVKTWADKTGIGAEAFAAEGVDPVVLRRAGWSIRGRRSRTARTPQRGASGKRVTAEAVRTAMPKGTFTAKGLQDSSGASAGVVRKVIIEQLAAGAITQIGPDPDHSGPGRAPILYKR
jgi:hypothetical protein